MAAGEWFGQVFHLSCGIFYAFTLYYDLQVPIKRKFGGRWAFLTFLDLVGIGRGSSLASLCPARTRAHGELLCKRLQRSNDAKRTKMESTFST